MKPSGLTSRHGCVPSNFLNFSYIQRCDEKGPNRGKCESLSRESQQNCLPWWFMTKENQINFHMSFLIFHRLNPETQSREDAKALGAKVNQDNCGSVFKRSG